MTSFELRAVGELVAERPSRARVLEDYGIDYCCGGKRPLDEACRQKQLSVEEVVAALHRSDGEQTVGDEPDWTTASLGQLIDNIVETYHGYLRRELPRLDEQNAKVCRAHGDGNENLAICHQVFREFCAEIRSHMMKEEQILFPAIKQLEAGQIGDHCFATIAGPIDVMEMEHDAAGNALARMRALTCDVTPPAGACTTYRVWLAGLAALERDMHTHVHKENNILFPRALELESTVAA